MRKLSSGYKPSRPNVSGLIDYWVRPDVYVNGTTWTGVSNGQIFNLIGNCEIDGESIYLKGNVGGSVASSSYVAGSVEMSNTLKTAVIIFTTENVSVTNELDSLVFDGGDGRLRFYPDTKRNVDVVYSGKTNRDVTTNFRREMLENKKNQTWMAAYDSNSISSTTFRLFANNNGQYSAPVNIKAVALFDKILTEQEYYEVYDYLNNVVNHNEFEPYKRVESIEGTGTQYINTKINYKYTQSYDFVFQNTRTDLNYATLFGVEESPNDYTLNLRKEGNSFIYRREGSPGGVFSAPVNNSKNHYILKTDGYSIDGGLSFAPIDKTYSEELDLPIFLFALNRGGYFTDTGYYRIYSFKIFEGTTLIQYLIPALDHSNKPAMFDTITGTYFYNQGTGDFIAGPII